MRRILLPVLATLLMAACAPAAAPSSGTETTASVAASSDTPSAAAARATRQAVFFGDSYFVGGGCSPDRKRGMAYIAGQQLGYQPVVRGFGDTGFVAVNEQYGGPDYLTQIKQGSLAANNPALVVIEGGDNDIGYPLTQIRRNARKVLNYARSEYPQARLILVGAMQTYGDFSQTDGINAGLRSVAKSLRVPFIDPQKWTYGHDDWLCSDYVHPTYAGHQILAAKLAKKLAKRGA